MDSVLQEEIIEKGRIQLKISEGFWPPHWRKLDNESLKSFISKGIQALRSQDQTLVKMALEVVMLCSSSKRIANLMKDEIVPSLHSVLVLGKKSPNSGLTMGALRVYQNLLVINIRPINYFKVMVADVVQGVKDQNLIVASVSLECLTLLFLSYDSQILREPALIIKVIQKNEKFMSVTCVRLLNSHQKNKYETVSEFLKCVEKKSFVAPEWKSLLVQTPWAENIDHHLESEEELEGLNYILESLESTEEGRDYLSQKLKPATKEGKMKKEESQSIIGSKSTAFVVAATVAAVGVWLWRKNE